MKTITIITEQLSDKALASITPITGVASVSVTGGRATSLLDHTDDIAVENFHGFRNPERFNPGYRIDVVLDDATVDILFESIATAYEAGFFADAEAWVNA